jgi:tetratricopeptide (TPR) repeat protein
VPLYNLAHVYRLTGRHEEAAKAFAEVVAKTAESGKWRAPGRMFTDARYWVGVEYVYMKRYPLAIEALLPLMDIKPLDAEAAKTLARAYEGIGDIGKATALYERALAVQPTDADAAAALKRLGK